MKDDIENQEVNFRMQPLQNFFTFTSATIRIPQLETSKTIPLHVLTVLSCHFHTDALKYGQLLKKHYKCRNTHYATLNTEQKLVKAHWRGNTNTQNLIPS